MPALRALLRRDTPPYSGRFYSLKERLLPAVHRPEEVLRARLTFGSASRCAELLTAFRDTGVQRVFVWPVTDELEQLRRFADEVVPLVG